MKMTRSCADRQRAPQGQRLDYWAAALNDAFKPLGLDNADPRAFESEMSSAAMGPIDLVRRACVSSTTAGCSLRDVQLIAGHQSIETTQHYIDGDTEAQSELMTLLSRLKHHFDDLFLLKDRADVRRASSSKPLTSFKIAAGSNPIASASAKNSITSIRRSRLSKSAT
jgi:hypothetical protein